MRRRNNNIFYGVDWLIILLFFLLVGFGWVNIYASSYVSSDISVFDMNYKFGKQLVFIALCVPLIVLILFMDSRFYERLSSVFYILGLLSLVGLFIFGKTINGASSWYGLGSNFSLQPSEFTKMSTALAISKLISDKLFDFKKTKHQLQAFFIIILPAFLVTMQPDPGSGLVYAAFILVFYREGLPLYYLIIGILALVIMLFTIYFDIEISIAFFTSLLCIFFIYLYIKKRSYLKNNWHSLSGLFIIITLYIFFIDFTYDNIFNQHHRDRFKVLFGISNDTKDIGYNSNQAIKTIANGGFWGKGFLKGERTQGRFVPEQHTDYIFTTIAEEWGFFGSTLAILVFALFIYRLLVLSENQKTTFARVYGYSVATIFLFHFIINIGMVIGILPTIGIPLPLMSYGGSALWGFTFLLFIFIRLDADKAYQW